MAVNLYTLDFGDDFFSFWHGGVHFIVINSQYYENSSQTQDLSDEQEAWLTNQLEESATQGAVHTVVFQHIPWFLKDVEEEKDYFNIEKTLRKKMLNKFHDAGVSKIFCGHYHRNAGGWFKDLEVVVTSAIGYELGDDPHGMRIVKVNMSDISHEYHSLVSFPTQVDFK